MLTCSLLAWMLSDNIAVCIVDDVNGLGLGAEWFAVWQSDVRQIITNLSLHNIREMRCVLHSPCTHQRSSPRRDSFYQFYVQLFISTAHRPTAMSETRIHALNNGHALSGIYVEYQRQTASMIWRLYSVFVTLLPSTSDGILPSPRY